jgi:hypothetical protein
MPHGRGVYVSAQGDRYEGEFRNGLMEGQGHWRIVGDGAYRGGMKDGLYHGTGRFDYEDGSVYEGSFAEGVYEGQGAWVHPDGESYLGQHHQGRRHGVGRYTWRNGDYYEGAFDRGYMHGPGTCSFDGAVGACLYRDDELISFEEDAKRPTVLRPS